MKRLALVLVVVLLCEVMLTEGVRSGGLATHGGKRLPTCDGKTCKADQYCDKESYTVPRCAYRQSGR
ncbi:hypothetical protein MTO96_001804 [Rhipicephalus appendiculatus]